MNTIIRKSEPYCWSGNKPLSIFGPMFTIVSVIPYAVPFINNMILSKQSSFCAVYLMVYMKVITAIAHILQSIIMWKRPFPECSPSILTKGGFPDPGIVYLWASALTSIFLSTMHSKRNKIIKEVARTVLLSRFLIVFVRKNKGVIFLTGQIAVYLVVYNLAYLASLLQIVLSILYATAVMIPMFWLIKTNMPKRYLP